MASKRVECPFWWASCCHKPREDKYNCHRDLCYKGKVCSQGEHPVRGLAQSRGPGRCPEDMGFEPCSYVGVALSRRNYGETPRSTTAGSAIHTAFCVSVTPRIVQ